MNVWLRPLVHSGGTAISKVGHENSRSRPCVWSKVKVTFDLWNSRSRIRRSNAWVTSKAQSSIDMFVFHFVAIGPYNKFHICSWKLKSNVAMKIEQNLIWLPIGRGHQFCQNESYYEAIAWAHYNDVKMSTLASQITCLTIVYSTVYSRVDQWKYLSPVSLDFVGGIHRRPVNSPHKGSVTRKMLPLYDVIMAEVRARRR